MTRPCYIDIDRPNGYDVVEPKHDGMWLEMTIGDGQAIGLARTGRERMRRPVATDRRAVIVGEYLVGTTRAKSHSQHRGVVAFDLLNMDGVDVRGLPLYKRRAMLADLVDGLGVGWLHVTPQYPAHMWRALWQQHVADDRPFSLDDDPWEGLVFKQSQSPYGDDWARRKRRVTTDFVCLGFNFARSGRYVGQVCSVIGSLPNGGTISVGGLSDHERHEFAANPQRFVGLTFEAAGGDHMPSGSLRHPTFCRWRTVFPQAQA